MFVFLATTIVALAFVAAMALLPKYRRRLVERMVGYQAKESAMGRRLYRYYKVALLVIVLCALAFPVVFQSHLVTSRHIPLLALAFFVVNLVAGVVFVAGFLKARGRLGLLLIVVIFASVLLGIIMGWIAKHG